MKEKEEEKREPIKPMLVVPDMYSILRWIEKNKVQIERLIAEILEDMDDVKRRVRYERSFYKKLEDRFKDWKKKRK